MDSFLTPTFSYRTFIEQTQFLLKDESIEFVAVTDIADFYSRIYHHRLDNALQSATSRQSHVRAIMHLFDTLAEMFAE